MPEPDVQRVVAAKTLLAEAQLQLELAVADALRAGGSVREVAVDGRLHHHRPAVQAPAWLAYVSEQRAGWEAEHARQDEFTARLEAATAILGLLGEGVDDPSTAEERQP